MSEYRTCLTWLDRIDRVIVARGAAELRPSSNTDTAEAWCAPRPSTPWTGLRIVDGDGGRAAGRRALSEVSFLSSRGYGFAQIERCSVAPTATAAELDLGAHVDDYVIETWRGPVPEHRLEHIALCKRRLSTDAPGDAKFRGERRAGTVST